MTKIKLKNRCFDLYISEKEIDLAVAKVADGLNAHFSNKNSDKNSTPLFVSVLSGAYMFTSDLMKKIEFESEIAFIKIASYNGLERGETIRNVLDLSVDIYDRDIIVVDEIVDSGNSLCYLKKEYLARGAASVTLATLIVKPKTITADVKIDHWGIEMVDDVFVVGYGLDYDEKGRNLKQIYALSEQ